MLWSRRRTKKGKGIEEGWWEVKEIFSGEISQLLGGGFARGRARWGLRGLKVCLLSREVTIQISYEVNVCMGGILLYQDML